MRKWKFLGFAGLLGIALAAPSLNVGALQKAAPGKSARLTLASAPPLPGVLLFVVN